MAQKVSLRSYVVAGVIVAFSQGSYGTVDEVGKYVRRKARSKAAREAYLKGKRHLSIQVANVRKAVLKQLEIEPLERTGGRLTGEEIAAIEAKLRLKQTQKRLRKLAEKNEVELSAAA